MKYTHRCPKCNSDNIAIADGYIGPYGCGNNITLRTPLFSFVSASVPVDKYICCNCGFTEEWVRQKDISKILNSKKVRH